MKDLSNRQLLVIGLMLFFPIPVIPLVALCYLTGWRFKDLA